MNNELLASLVEFTKEVRNIPKNVDNKFLKTKYADLAMYLEIINPILIKHGLVINQYLELLENVNIFNMTYKKRNEKGYDLITEKQFLVSETLITRLSHISGQFIESKQRIIIDNPDPQKIGATITYYRRYQLAAILNLASSEDDGNTSVTGITKIAHDGKEVVFDASVVNDSVPLCDVCGGFDTINNGMYKDYPEQGKYFCQSCKNTFGFDTDRKGVQKGNNFKDRAGFSK